MVRVRGRRSAASSPQDRRRFTTGRLVWGGLLRVLQRITHYKHGDQLEFKINFSVRDLLTDKGRAVKDQVEALVQAVQKAGSYQAKDEAARAVHAVMDALKDRVPPDVLIEAERVVCRCGRPRVFGRAASQRLQKDERGRGDVPSLGEAPSAEATHRPGLAGAASPLTTPRGRSRATRGDIPAPSITATTRSTSL